jgi:trehalose 6-phosphate phosphatase
MGTSEPRHEQAGALRFKNGHEDKRIATVAERNCGGAGLTLVETLDKRSIALLLDVDGTLLDIAPTPGAVTVEPALRGSLARLAQITAGGLALVSGRPVADLDRIFAPLALPAIGAHGAELRLVPDGRPVQRLVDVLDDRIRGRLSDIAARNSEIVGEDKGSSFALHFRLAPEHERAVREEVAAVCADLAPASVEVLPGKAMIEVKRPNIDKGRAVRELMAHAPFRGRRPVFIGDDVTDDYVFAVLPEFDGFGFSVGRTIDGLAGCFDDPGEVRRWLAHLASGQGARPE